MDGLMKTVKISIGFFYIRTMEFKETAPQKYFFWFGQSRLEKLYKRSQIFSKILIFFWFKALKLQL